MCSISWNDSIYFQNDTQMTTAYKTDFCTTIVEIDAILTRYLLHIMHIPVLTLIIITLFGKENEDAKWFVFHTAILNLILGITWEISYIFPALDEYGVISIMVDFSLNLSVNSIFPLAFTKFFFLYFPSVYSNVFNVKTIFPLFLFYDLLSLGLFFWSYFSSSQIIIIVGTFLMLIGTIFCSSGVFIKIRKMMSLVDHSSKLSTYSDLRRAGFICIFQTCLISIHLINTLYVTLYLQLFMYWISGESAITFWDLYMVLMQLRYPIYQLFIIIDTSVTLFVLRSYRNVLKKCGLFLFDFAKMVVTGKKPQKKSTITFVKSVNNFTAR